MSAQLLNKVFVIGFNKMGTTTLHTLFTQWGLKSLHECYNEYPLTHAAFKQYQCFSDGEQHDYVALDRQFPSSKFVLATRRLDDWLVSRVRHAQHLKSFGFMDWMAMEYERDPAQALKLWIVRRQDYLQRVNAYFGSRQQQLLVLDVCRSDQQQRTMYALAAHIGVNPGVELALPHANKSDNKKANSGEVEVPKLPGQTQLRSKEVIRAEVESVLAALRVPREMWSHDGIFAGALERFRV